MVVSALTNLERLDLTDTRITNATLKAVGRLPHLRALNLSFTGGVAAAGGWAWAAGGGTHAEPALRAEG